MQDAGAKDITAARESAASRSTESRLVVPITSVHRVGTVHHWLGTPRAPS